MLGADSAGGGLATALMYYLRDNGYPLPSGAILFSPWVDLTMSCDSWDTNSAYDYLVVPGSHDHMNPVRAYLGDNLDKYITHPYASPLFGDMRGLPPLLIQCGDAECLRDEVTLLAHKASLAGVAVRHELYEDCVHVFQAFLFLDASRKALQSCRHFVRTALDKRTGGKGGPKEVTKDARGRMDQEMRENMGNSKGEKVEPRTGVRRGDWKEGKPESDTEVEPTTMSGSGAGAGSSSGGAAGKKAGGEGREDDSDEDWELHRRGSSEGRRRSQVASALQPAKAAATVLGVGDSAVTQMENNDVATDKRREAAGNAAASTRVGQQAEAGASSSQPVPSSSSRRKSHDATSSTSSKTGTSPFPLSISLEEAQERAQAGMRAQESSGAPPLARFHDPTEAEGSSFKPKMRREKSNAAIQGMMEEYERARMRKELNMRVFTPGSGAGGGAGQGERGGGGQGGSSS